MMIAWCERARCRNSESVGVFVRNLQQSTVMPWTRLVAIEADLGRRQIFRTWLHFGADKKDKIEPAFRGKFRRIKWIALGEAQP